MNLAAENGKCELYQPRNPFWDYFRI